MPRLRVVVTLNGGASVTSDFTLPDVPKASEHGRWVWFANPEKSVTLPDGSALKLIWEVVEPTPVLDTYRG
jgi:hypothetical protein